jgi:hypothetical protein
MTGQHNDAAFRGHASYGCNERDTVIAGEGDIEKDGIRWIIFQNFFGLVYVSSFPDIDEGLTFPDYLFKGLPEDR